MLVESTRMRIELTRMRVESTCMHTCDSFYKQPHLCACNLGLFLYCNKVVQHATCENQSHECENHRLLLK
jgi:hypothetical protein